MEEEGQAGRFPLHFHPRSFRHTYASLHLQAGKHLHYVSRMLGHASIAMSSDLYGSWLKPDRRPNLDDLDPVVEGAGR